MFCPKCGFESPEGRGFCMQCGARLPDNEASGSASEKISTAASAPEIPAFQSAAPVNTITVFEAPAKENTAKKKLPKSAAVRKKAPASVITILTIVFGLFIFIFGLYSAVALPVSGALSNNAVSSAFVESKPAEVLVGELAEDEDFIAFLDEQNLYTENLSEDMTLAEFIVETSGMVNLDEEDIEEILEVSPIMELIGSIIKSYEDYIVTGNTDLTLSRSELKKQIEELRSSLLKYANYDINDDKELLEELIDSNIKDIKKIHPEETIGNLGSFTAFILNPIVIVAIIALGLAMIVILIVVSRNPVPTLMMSGIQLIIDGAVASVISLLPDTIIKSAGITVRSQRKYILEIISPLTNNLLISGLIFAAVGAVLIIAAIISMNIIRKTRGD